MLKESSLPKIGLIGGGFQHAFSSTFYKAPSFFSFSKENIERITFFIDDAIISNLGKKKCEVQVAWVVESRTICPNLVSSIKANLDSVLDSYDYIITHNEELLDLNEKFVYFPPHGFWIENPQIYNKTKLVSMMSSNKNWTSGHKTRLSFVDKFKDKLDLFGRGFKEVSKKEEALADYMFSVTIENDVYNTYWTEKILDCFACGTIPVYYGAPNIEKFFNKEGIIFLNDSFTIDQLSLSLYESKKDAILDNFNRCMKYDVIEDNIWKSLLENL